MDAKNIGKVMGGRQADDLGVRMVCVWLLLEWKGWSIELRGKVWHIAIIILLN